MKRRMGFQSIVRWLLPRSDQFYGFLERQAAVAHQGALTLARFGSRTEGSAQEIADQVQALEHQGDRIVHELEEELAKTFVTPIDREDLQRLSVDLDDILDLTNAFARCAVLYGVEKPTTAMSDIAKILVESTELLNAVMPALRRGKYQELIDAARIVRKHEKAADQIYRQETSRLFHDVSIDPRELIRQKALLDDIENAVDRCERLASTLTTVAVKHA
ncbi:MAG: DUF47 family protein [Deltaproteobacteria bacterium]|jgi:hypothetical protein|nr:DUF47 family protein [Deltaproteobacteria bacterium]